MMKLTNTGFQGFNIFLLTPNGPKSFWINPKEVILLQESTISDQIRRMVQKKLFRLEGFNK